MHVIFRVVGVAICVGLLAEPLVADMLILRSGTRLRGELIAVRGSTVEFDEVSSSGRRRTLQVSRDEVAGIYFDEGQIGGSGGSDGDFSGQVPGPTDGARERGLQVSASTPWTDTGVTVRAGQMIAVQATGQVRWGRNRRDGPNGENDSPFNAARPLPNRAGGALIGRVGDDREMFFVGGGGTIRVRQSGRLYLGINDEFLDDNSGSFRVIVRY